MRVGLEVSNQSHSRQLDGREYFNDDEFGALIWYAFQNHWPVRLEFQFDCPIDRSVSGFRDGLRFGITHSSRLDLEAVKKGFLVNASRVKMELIATNALHQYSE
jgi:hypothetical protein